MVRLLINIWARLVGTAMVIAGAALASEAVGHLRNGTKSGAGFETPAGLLEIALVIALGVALAAGAIVRFPPVNATRDTKPRSEFVVIGRRVLWMLRAASVIALVQYFSGEIRLGWCALSWVGAAAGEFIVWWWARA